MRGIPLLTIALIAAGGLTLQAADSEKPASDGNTTLLISGTAITQPEKIQELLGIAPKDQKDDDDESLHMVVIRLRAEPQRPEGLRIDPDDFTLIARNTGERAKAMEPDEINNEAQLELARGNLVGSNGYTIGGGKILGPQLPNASQANSPEGIGNAPMGIDQPAVATTLGGGNGGTNPVREIADDTEGAKKNAKPTQDPRVAILDQMALHEVETTEPVEGLLYFLMRTKVKSKNVGLLYVGAGGRLVIDFN